MFDPDIERAKTVGWEAGAPDMAFEALLAASDAMIVAAPADAHHRLAAAVLRAGKHVLVEKPIAATVRQAEELGILAQDHGCVLQVGHLERFSAAFQALRDKIGPPLNGAPLYIEASRIAPFKPRGTDVSVILDLMIHDLDLVLALVDSDIESIDAIGAAVASTHEDIANARLRFQNGAVATITASRISPRTERRMRIFAQDRYLAADFAARKLTVIGRTPSGRRPEMACRRAGLSPVPGVAGFSMEEVAWEDHDSLAAEHAAFVASVLDGAPVLVDAAVGTARPGGGIGRGGRDACIARPHDGIRADFRRLRQRLMAFGICAPTYPRRRANPDGDDKARSDAPNVVPLPAYRSTSAAGRRSRDARRDTFPAHRCCRTCRTAPSAPPPSAAVPVHHVRRRQYRVRPGRGPGSDADFRLASLTSQVP